MKLLNNFDLKTTKLPKQQHIKKVSPSDLYKKHFLRDQKNVPLPSEGKYAKPSFLVAKKQKGKRKKGNTF